jgi:hypothetical protein
MRTENTYNVGAKAN